MIKIEKDIPLPVRNGGPQRLYPFKEMEIGDSFLAPIKQSAASGHARRASLALGRKFTTATVQGGTRIWRIE
jgi:predicted signal transduction protein with EAL and GGDEF domain